MQRLNDNLRRWAEGPWQGAAAGLVLLGLSLFLPGLAMLPPVDRDEVSFAQASRQMYASGDLVDIRLQDAPRYKKPVGIYWLQAASVALTGGRGEGAIVTYRAVSVVAALAAVLMTWRIGTLLAGGAAGIAAAVLLAASFLLGAEARLAKTDATLLATVLGAQWVLARLWTGGRAAVSARVALAFWAALGLSVLVKGPIGPMVVGLTVAVLMGIRRDWRWAGALRPGRGLVLCLAIVLPWYVAITLRTGGEFWAAALGRDLIGKVAEAQESHGAPPGSYLAAMWLTFWPASLALALGLPALWATRRGAATAFLLAWILPTWVVFELVATKLVHYVLPVYPALAILAAAGILATPRPLAGFWRRAVAVVLLAVPVLALGALALAARRYGADWPLPAVAGIAGSLAVSVVMWRALRKGWHFAALAGMALQGLVLAAGVYPTLAGVRAIWPSAALAGVRDAFDGCADPVLIVAGYREPSVVFALGRDVRLAGGAEAGGLFAASPCALAFVEDGARPAFDRALAAAGVVPDRIGRVEGTNIGSGDQLRLEIFATASR